MPIRLLLYGLVCRAAKAFRSRLRVICMIFILMRHCLKFGELAWLSENGVCLWVL